MACRTCRGPLTNNNQAWSPTAPGEFGRHGVRSFLTWEDEYWRPGRVLDPRFRGAGMGSTGGVDDGSALVEVIASVPAEVTAETLVRTGQVMYTTGYQRGQSTGLVYGALIGAALLLLFK